MSLHVLGVSHRTATAHERAAFSLDPEKARELLQHAALTAPDLEALVLATCNRTEFYLSGADAVERWRECFADLCPAAPALEGTRWYHLQDEAAVRHLLRVACGLDSALLGDGQVLGQLRRALTTAQDAGTTGPVLSSVVSTALRAGRRARAETQIGQGAPGIGSAVADTVRGRGVPPPAGVLVLGAGEAGRSVIRALRKAGYENLVLSNRTATRGEDLARVLALTWVDWQDLAPRVATVSVVVAATAAPQAVLRGAFPRLPGQHLLVIDAGFPPQVSPEVAEPLVQVVSLSALTGATDLAAQARKAAEPAVEALIAEQVGQWVLEEQRRPIEQAIKQLHTEAAALTRSAARVLASSSDLSAEAVENLLRKSVRGLLHDHVSRLRSLHPRPAS
jgi:glutamyl-tRNA reductase